MLNNITIGRYYPANSLIHKMHPLAKILVTLLFIISLFITDNLIYLGLLTILLMGMLLLSKVPFMIYIKSIKGIKIIIIFILIINLLCGVNIILTLSIIIKMILIVLITSLLTLSTSPTEIAYGLETLFMPLRIIGIPVNKMALSISLALRFIPTIIDEGNKILKSQASRGVDYYNSNIKGKFLALKAIILPMFALSIKRADQLSETMEIRLYDINKKRTNYRINKWSLFDTFAVCLFIFVLIFMIYRVII